MSPELEAAAAEATAEKAEAWEKFTAACAAWCRDVLHSPEDHRALADAACEYAGKRVQRHVAEAVAAEREAILGLIQIWVAGPRPLVFLDLTDAIRARSQAPGKPLPPEVLADALQDRPHPASGRLLSAAPVFIGHNYTATEAPPSEVTETRSDASPLPCENCTGKTSHMAWCIVAERDENLQLATDLSNQVSALKAQVSSMAARLADSHPWAGYSEDPAGVIRERDDLKAELAQSVKTNGDLIRLMQAREKEAVKAFEEREEARVMVMAEKVAVIKHREQVASLRAALEEMRLGCMCPTTACAIDEALAKWGQP